MRQFLRPVLAILITILFISCKNDKQQTIETVNEAVTDSVETAEKMVRSEETIAQSNSVMARIMTTKETRRVSGFMVTADLANTLLKEEGPFTIFAPEDSAFESLSEDEVKTLPQQENRQALVNLLQGHIVKGNYDSATLAQQLELGKVELTSLSGSILTVSKQGSDIIVKDSNGSRAKVGKSDILASNGIVHVIDKLLRSN